MNPDRVEGRDPLRAFVNAAFNLRVLQAIALVVTILVDYLIIQLFSFHLIIVISYIIFLKHLFVFPLQRVDTIYAFVHLLLCSVFPSHVHFFENFS
mgnify:CR=1 FL=1